MTSHEYRGCPGPFLDSLSKNVSNLAGSDEKSALDNQFDNTNGQDSCFGTTKIKR